MRYTGPSCRQCRREGTKLFLKGTKCFTEKCPVERRPYAPGQHGQNTARRRKVSEYAKQLREKQKIKRIYGVSERQFRNTFEKVSALPGVTGHNLLAALESRLDNMVYRMGFAPSRKAARQLIRHRHIEVDGKSVDIPSYAVQPGQEIKMRQASRELALVKEALEVSSRGQAPTWLAVDKDTFSGRMLERPQRAMIPIAAQEQLVVELYSK
ncbi:MAG TPA: 30S ribosomal protein S4 [Gemmatimonadaceae bacterium]|jgi:small subunit ribosomal protein S4|nr:30S ribosomal protein S4 [Gemmatimonadaceae bacterium]HRQ78729.1 30S ribosomal protein S4 [Gemmatimonadaceae bacterium]